MKRFARVWQKETALFAVASNESETNEEKGYFPFPMTNPPPPQALRELIEQCFIDVSQECTHSSEHNRVREYCSQCIPFKLLTIIEDEKKSTVEEAFQNLHHFLGAGDELQNKTEQVVLHAMFPQ